jgi:hypothetical protein
LHGLIAGRWEPDDFLVEELAIVVSGKSLVINQIRRGIGFSKGWFSILSCDKFVMVISCRLEAHNGISCKKVEKT